MTNAQELIKVLDQMRTQNEAMTHASENAFRIVLLAILAVLGFSVWYLEK
jgi:hypothetical protein